MRAGSGRPRALGAAALVIGGLGWPSCVGCGAGVRAHLGPGPHAFAGWVRLAGWALLAMGRLALGLPRCLPGGLVFVRLGCVRC